MTTRAHPPDYVSLGDETVTLGATDILAGSLDGIHNKVNCLLA